MNVDLGPADTIEFECVARCVLEAWANLPQWTLGKNNERADMLTHTGPIALQ
jgi:hypothetical protein